MKFFVYTALALAGSSASAADSVSLYAQACLPYMDSHQIHFHCAKEETVSVTLQDIGPGHKRGAWEKTIQLGTEQLVVNLEVEKVTAPNGQVVPVVTGTIQQADGTRLVTATEVISDSTSVSLASLTPFGERGEHPTFFFGTPGRFNVRASELALRGSFPR